MLVILGGPSDIAYENGERDYDNISALVHPIMLFSKDIGHGGDLGSANGGDFTRINLAWLNWWMKGDEGATGKGVLVGSGCTYCTDSRRTCRRAVFFAWIPLHASGLGPHHAFVNSGSRSWIR